MEPLRSLSIAFSTLFLSLSLSLSLSLFLFLSIPIFVSVSLELCFSLPRGTRDRIRECESERARQAWVANSFTPYSTAVERPTTTFSQCFDQLRADSTSERQSARSHRTNRAGLRAPRSLAEVVVSLAVFKSCLAAHGKRGSLLKNKQRLLDKLGSGATGLADGIRADCKQEMQGGLILGPPRW